MKINKDPQRWLGLFIAVVGFLILLSKGPIDLNSLLNNWFIILVIVLGLVLVFRSIIKAGGKFW